MATVLLQAIAVSQSPARTVAQDLESFLWVLIYVAYKNAIDEGGANMLQAPMRELLEKDFSKLFRGPSPEKLIEARHRFIFDSSDFGKAPTLRLFGYASRRNNEEKNFYAVLHHVIIALQDTWPHSSGSTEFVEDTKAMRRDIKTTRGPNEPPPPETLDYDRVITVLQQFWESPRQYKPSWEN